MILADLVRNSSRTKQNHRTSPLFYMHLNFPRIHLPHHKSYLSKVLILIHSLVIYENRYLRVSVPLGQGSVSSIVWWAKDEGWAQVNRTVLVVFMEGFGTPELSVFFNAGSLDVEYFLRWNHALTVAPTREVPAGMTEESQHRTSRQFMNGFEVNWDRGFAIALYRASAAGSACVFISVLVLWMTPAYFASLFLPFQKWG